MSSVEEQLLQVDGVISRNIDKLSDSRDLLSQNVLSQLRNLVEGVLVLVYKGTLDATFHYNEVGSALTHIKGQGQYRYLVQFHEQLQASTSHYTVDAESSERLMLKYYAILQRVRDLVIDIAGLNILNNLESFPLADDPELEEYHQAIIEKVDHKGRPSEQNVSQGRYYVHSIRPLVAGRRVFYEVVICPAINNVNKSDRIVAFTDLVITDNYSALLTLHTERIHVLGVAMPITIIRDWRVSIRPCEIDNFAKLLGVKVKCHTKLRDYRYLMKHLTLGSGHLLDLMDMSDVEYASLRSKAIGVGGQTGIFQALDKAREIIGDSRPGSNLLRYLMVRMRNEVIKDQYSPTPCDRLSGLNVQRGCIPFDTMPLCTSPKKHNASYRDLAESIDFSKRKHQLLARLVWNNAQNRGHLYTPAEELERFGDVDALISEFNEKVYSRHTHRKLLRDKGQVFIKGHEDTTVDIINQLQGLASGGAAGYSEKVMAWLAGNENAVDDEHKVDVLKQLFGASKVSVIFGAAGTGKTTLVSHIADLFAGSTKLFLAHTNSAKDNLQRRVSSKNSTFRTVAKHIRSENCSGEFDLLVVDECSIVSNEDILKVIEKTSYKLLVLVGDDHQIESIDFGNWFRLARLFVPQKAIFELKTPYRTSSQEMLEFWNKVRGIDYDIPEFIARNGYSAPLNELLSDSDSCDEIVLCLNYDGLYGVNNINRILQNHNPSPPVVWRDVVYKVGDPVVFTDTPRFRPVIFNGLKGKITDVARDDARIRFHVELDRSVSESDVTETDLTWIEGSTVSFTVDNYDISESDGDSHATTVPFQVAYAVSIHKAQGSEYDSVKVVITEANEDDVTHSVLYTAVTRAKEKLKIYWTPATQHKVLESLQRSQSQKEVAILEKRRGVKPFNVPKKKRRSR